MLVCRREVVKRALDVFSWSIFGWRIVGVPLTPGKVRCVCLVVPHWESSVDLMRCQFNEGASGTTFTFKRRLHAQELFRFFR